MKSIEEGPFQYIEPDTHSFVVKLWLDNRDETAEQRVWRGHITHVASDQHGYFDTVPGLIGFLLPYLRAMRIKIPVFWRIYQWLNH